MKFSDRQKQTQSGVQDALKRGFDILLSGSGLIFSSPIWLLAGVAIVLEDGFPIFFRQSRWGKGGRAFSALKFRSMRKGSEKDRSIQAGQEDPRITRVGRFLRACSESDRDVPDEAIPGFRERLMVRPGLTGIAQIFADRDVTRARKFRYDLLYIQRRNFWLDIRLIVLSFYISFRGRWEVRGDKF